MKALSLTQPWATLLASGAKQIETRSWRTYYRGPIAIHAAKGFPRWVRDFCQDEPFASALSGSVESLPLGAIIGLCDLVDCVPTQSIRFSLSKQERLFGEYADGRWAWICKNPRLLIQPVKCRGALSLWDVPAEQMMELVTVAGRSL